jgi:hypothetical protein
VGAKSSRDFVEESNPVERVDHNDFPGLGYLNKLQLTVGCAMMSKMPELAKIVN